MKKIIVTAIAPFAFASIAHAAEVEGKVSDIDPENGVVTLEDGQTFTVGEDVDLEGIEAGTTVKITHDDGSDVATAIEIE